MAKIRQEVKKLLNTIVQAGRTHVTTEQMRTLAVATGNTVAVKYLDTASIEEQAALKQAIAAKDPMFEQPVNQAKDDATVFGMSGSDKTLDKEEQKQIYSTEKVAPTDPDDKDMRKRTQREEHRPDTSDHKADVKAVMDALKPAPNFPQILNRSKNDPVEKRDKTATIVTRSTVAKLAKGDLDIYGILSEYPGAAAMVSNVSAALEYSIDGAMAFCLHLLEEVNAHSEMSEVEALFQKQLGAWEANASKTAVKNHLAERCGKMSTKRTAAWLKLKDLSVKGQDVVQGDKLFLHVYAMNDGGFLSPRQADEMAAFLAEGMSNQETIVTDRVYEGSKKTAQDGAGPSEKQRNAEDHVPGVPDGTGPYGRGMGPGQGKGDGSGMRNKPDKDGEGKAKVSEEAVKKFFEENKTPTDKQVHDWATKQGYDEEDVEELAYKMLAEFLAPKKEPGNKPPEVDEQPEEAHASKKTTKAAQEIGNVMDNDSITLTDDTGAQKTMVPAGTDPITGELMLVPEGTEVTKMSTTAFDHAAVKAEIRLIATEVNQKLTTEEEDDVNQFIQRELVMNRADLKIPQHRQRIANVIDGIIKHRK
jgi:hypothetical protein